MEVTLYGLSTCPYCRMTKKYLDEHDVQYTLVEVDKLQGDERQAAVDTVKSLSGGTSFPVISANGQVVVGFNKPKLASLLGF